MHRPIHMGSVDIGVRTATSDGRGRSSVVPLASVDCPIGVYDPILCNAMDFIYESGEWYRLGEVYDCISRGMSRLAAHPEHYERLSPCDTTIRYSPYGAFEILEEVMHEIDVLTEEWSIRDMWIRWC